MAAAMMKELMAPLEQRPSFPDFLRICKEILNAPQEQEAFKRLCITNGLKFKQQTMNMMGLGKSPVWWTFTFEADRMLTRKFALTALPQNGLVSCASHELSQLVPPNEADGDQAFEAEFDYALSVAQEIFGAPALSGRDQGNHKYAAWRGANAYLLIFQSPPDDLSPRRSLDIWWEAWNETQPPAIDGVVAEWLQRRHPGLF